MEGPNINNKFPKKDRIKSRKAIELLFEKGKVHHIYPFRLVFSISVKSSACGLFTLVAVPKKYLKRSVDRNHMKRLMRESFRTQNHALKAAIIQYNVSMELAFIFTSKKLLTFTDVEKGMALSMNYLINIIRSLEHSENHSVAGPFVSTSSPKAPDNQ